MQPDLTILIAFHNEEGNVLPLTREVVAALAGGPSYELVYVDDGSTDGTAAEIRQALAEAGAPGRMLRHGARAGQSAAYWTGLKYARAAWVQIIDGDGQQDPADIRRVWDALIAPGAPADLGLVMGRRASRNDGAVKFVSSRIANIVRKFLLNDGVRDSGCGFRLIRAEAARDLAFFGAMHRFLAALVRRTGWRVEEIVVADRPRRAGVSKYGTLKRLALGVLDLLGVAWLSRRTRPGVTAEDESF